MVHRVSRHGEWPLDLPLSGHAGNQEITDSVQVYDMDGISSLAGTGESSNVQGSTKLSTKRTVLIPMREKSRKSEKTELGTQKKRVTA